MDVFHPHTIYIHIHREIFKKIVLELRTFVLKHILSSTFSISEKNGEKKKG